MADISFDTSPASAARRGAAIGRVRALRAGWDRWRRYRRTLDELDSMSDRDLDDLGIARSAIRRIAREDAYGR